MNRNHKESKQKILINEMQEKIGVCDETREDRDNLMNGGNKR